MHGVHLLGFSAFERSTLASCLRLAAQRLPAYAQAEAMADAEFVVADADRPDVVAAVEAAGRVADTIFVGRRAPFGAAAWMARPLDALLLLRELDAIVSMRVMADAPPAPPAAPATVADAWPAEVLAPQAWPADVLTPHGWAAEAPAAPAPAAPAGPAPATPRAQALIVDDSEVAQRFLAQRLQRLGIGAASAATSGEALARVAAQRWDWIFVDVELGDASELDGLSLCRRIKRSGAAGDAVVVVVSAYHGQVDRVRGALAGADAYLGKPLDEVELARLVARPPRPLARAG